MIAKNAQTLRRVKDLKGKREVENGAVANSPYSNSRTSGDADDRLEKSDKIKKTSVYTCGESSQKMQKTSTTAVLTHLSHTSQALRARSLPN